MGYAKPTAARLIDQRARRRATQALIEKYRDEFGLLYEMHRRAAEVEAGTLAEKAAEIHPSNEPPRLMPGARKPGQDVTERIDVARCPHCIGHHDRGHVCTNCGAAPGSKKPSLSPEDVAEDVEFLLEADPLALAENIAHRLGYAERSGVQNALIRAGRRDLLDRLARNAQVAGHGVKGRTA